MINRVVLVGRLTKDPELKYTQSGIAVCRFTLAVNRSFSNQQGEREADFVSCVAWRKQAENIANYLRKGSLAGVDGRIQTGSFEGSDGKRVYTTEVVADSTQFLEPKGNRSENPNSSQQNQQPNQQTNQYPQQNSGYNQQQPQHGNQSTNQYPPRHPNQNQNYAPPQQTQQNDPFQPNGGPIQVSDDDLPF